MDKYINTDLNKKQTPKYKITTKEETEYREQVVTDKTVIAADEILNDLIKTGDCPKQ